MRVLMLGWEFPPFISGGLGTACQGLTRAMSARGAQILFVLPRAVDPVGGQHLRIAGHSSQGSSANPGVLLRPIPSRLVSPYASPGALQHNPLLTTKRELPRSYAAQPGLSQAGYGGDLLAEVRRYACFCSQWLRDEQFDVIHAHDWMTFPAAMAVAAQSGKPLIVHMHSTEFDRAGEHGHRQVYQIEREGLHAASAVICVSKMTKAMVNRRYGVPESRLSVVYNGIDRAPENAPAPAMRRNEKVVLFLGRLTMQKGPEYFVAAARRVLEKLDDVRFVMAGAGDLLHRTIEQAAAEGIGHKILFTGFLRAPEVDRVFGMADLYVMPSVSEPFGIAPLEAVRRGVPVLISKNSGVSEVLRHALKVDFWDVDEMANKIVNVLRRPPLGDTLRGNASREIRDLTWETAAAACLNVYRQAGGLG